MVYYELTVSYALSTCAATLWIFFKLLVWESCTAWLFFLKVSSPVQQMKQILLIFGAALSTLLLSLLLMNLTIIFSVNWFIIYGTSEGFRQVSHMLRTTFNHVCPHRASISSVCGAHSSLQQPWVVPLLLHCYLLQNSTHFTSPASSCTKIQ